LKIIVTILAFVLSTVPGFSQYWQQQVNYTINVSLNDTAHSLDGFEKIDYTNHSPDTLKYIWFHIWPNAYKNDQTAFSDQLLESGNTKFYFSDKEQKGYINRLDFRVDERTAQTEDHPQHIDIIKLLLPVPLAPGQTARITTPFHVKLPYNFSRGGYEGQSFQVTQWYPKPAVYDSKGWHPMPYLDQGEFYSEFGNFDVNITVPRDYVIAATGEFKKEIETTAAGSKTLRYTQDNVHDFAWFADKRFHVDHDSVEISAGHVIRVNAYYVTKNKAWQHAAQSAKNAILHYSKLVGEYPYNVVSVVEGPESFGGGMEYPTITVISPTDNENELENTIVHEVGHNWFFGILASNERDYPWMDEGINSFYDEKYKRIHQGDYAKLERIAFETKAIMRQDQPAGLSSDKYTALNYDLSVYYKTSEWLRYIESTIGEETFNQVMQQYYKDWKFKHPQPGDLKNSFEKVTGKNFDSEFELLNKKGLLPNQQRKGALFIPLPSAKNINAYLKNPTKDIIAAGPAIGINSYDQVMIGAFVTNFKLPPSPFQFLVVPMYATGSKRLTGLGLASYSFYPENTFSVVDIGVSASHFTMRKYEDDKGKKNFLAFTKIVPGFKLTLKQKDPRSQVSKFIQFKSFFITEQGLKFYRDTLITGIDTTITDKYNVTSTDRNLQQLRFVIQNNRALYPYNGELKAEAGKNFLRFAFTGNYFFNYKQGGLNLRLFAGKFFYTGAKTPAKEYATQRYHLNLSGPAGFEDYTYSDYFVGRTHFEGWQSQQIMIRDGAFKVSTPLLAEQVGKTDDWLAAINLTSTIPAGINPFNLLPIKLPVKLFMDIGTWADTWKQDASTDRFLYDAGLYLSLFKETVNIYVPLFYSNVFRDYYKSTINDKQRFWKKLSFCIDISNLNFRKIDRNISF
jgi:hypothetical protein